MRAMDPDDFDKLTVLGLARLVHEGVQACDFLTSAHKLEAAKTMGHLPSLHGYEDWAQAAIVLLDAFLATPAASDYWCSLARELAELSVSYLLIVRAPKGASEDDQVEFFGLAQAAAWAIEDMGYEQANVLFAQAFGASAPGGTAAMD